MVSMAPAASPSIPFTNNSNPPVMPDSGMMSAPKRAPSPARATDGGEDTVTHVHSGRRGEGDG